MTLAATARRSAHSVTGAHEMASESKVAEAAPLAAHEVRFEGGVLQRGQWFDVWAADRIGAPPRQDRTWQGPESAFVLDLL
jgi:hypothetical protein